MNIDVPVVLVLLDTQLSTICAHYVVILTMPNLPLVQALYQWMNASPDWDLPTVARNGACTRWIDIVYVCLCKERKKLPTQYCLWPVYGLSIAEHNSCHVLLPPSIFVYPIFKSCCAECSTYQWSWCCWGGCSYPLLLAENKERLLCGREHCPWPWTGRVAPPLGSSTIAPTVLCNMLWLTGSWREEQHNVNHIFWHFGIVVSAKNVQVSVMDAPFGLLIDVSINWSWSVHTQTSKFIPSV